MVSSINSPSTGKSNSSISITGSAFIKDSYGKTNAFYGYQLFYASPPNYNFKAIGNLKKKPIYNDILGYWDTKDLKKRFIPTQINYSR